MTETESLADRLTRLERQVRWWQAISVLVLVGLGLLSAFGSVRVSTQAEVRARRFGLIGADGKERVTLGVESWSEAKDDKTDFVGVRLLDNRGKVVAELGLRSEYEKAFLHIGPDGGKDSLSLNSGSLRVSGDEGWTMLGPGQVFLAEQAGQKRNGELQRGANRS